MKASIIGICYHMLCCPWKPVSLNGFQENANLEDMVRFFDDYELMGNPVTVLKQVR